VCTIAAEIVRTIIQPGPQTAQLSRQLLNSLSGQKKSEAGSKVATIALRPIETKVPRSGRRYNGSAHKQTEGTITVNAQERDAVKLLF